MSEHRMTFHSDGYRDGHAAVNVKVDLPYPWPSASMFNKAWLADGFTPEWCEEHLDDDDWDNVFQFACESQFEMVVEDAEELYGRRLDIYREGRQAGWVVVDNFTREVVEDWDDDDWQKWEVFAEDARGCADAVPEVMLDLVYLNDFARWKDEQDEIAEAEAEIESMRY